MKTKLAFLLVAIFICGAAFSQEEEGSYQLEKKNEFRVEFFDLFFNSMIFHYERHLPSSSVVLRTGPTIKVRDSQERIGFKGELQYRIYARPKYDNGYKGIYVGPYFTYSYLEDSRVYSTYTGSTYQLYDVKDMYSSFALGFQGGIKLAISNTVSFDFYMGAGMRYSMKSNDNPFESQDTHYYEDDFVFDPGYTGLMPKMGISFGMMF